MRIAITGSTGGIMTSLCKDLVLHNYDLILINRNLEKSLKQKEELLKIKAVNIDFIIADMQDINDVDKVYQELKNQQFDYLILASAIYNVKLKKLDTNYNNVFQVNFISPYYLVNKLMDKDIRFIVIGSVAYNYQEIELDDIDLSNSKKKTHIYGNSKRYLMFSLMGNEKVRIAHPGITLTNLTNHYPKWINWLVKIAIKILFPSNKKAARNIYYALDNNTNDNEWIGPRLFNIWGRPKKSFISIKEEERSIIKENAVNIYHQMEEYVDEHKRIKKLC